MAQLDGVIAIASDPHWDKITIASVTQTPDNYFFKKAVGEADPVGANTKNEVDTSLTVGGQLNDGERFEVRAVSLVEEFASVTADVAKLRNKALYQLFVTGAIVFKAPACLLPSGTGISRTDAASGYVGTPQPQAIYVLSEPILIKRQFHAALKIPSPIAMTAVLVISNFLHGPHQKGVGIQA